MRHEEEKCWEASSRGLDVTEWPELGRFCTVATSVCLSTAAVPLIQIITHMQMYHFYRDQFNADKLIMHVRICLPRTRMLRAAHVHSR